MLDFQSLAAQIQTLLDETPEGFDPRAMALDAARRACASCDGDGSFNATIRGAMKNAMIPESWHPALLLDDAARLCGGETAPDAPLPHCVAAADGSQIYPDAHQIDSCYLLNLSGVALRYDDPQARGSETDNAILAATPHLFGFAPDDLWHAAARESFINREFVDARRHVAELDELAQLLESAPCALTIGLGDGIFDLRVAASQGWKTFAEAENLRALDRLRATHCPVGGYIAASRATDVVTALRVVAMSGGDAGGDEVLAGLSDVRLFNALLSDGERSPVFGATRGQSRGASAGEGARHATCFFYLKIESNEVARIEFPIWVAQSAGWIEILHAIVLAQISKGDGYPIALMEAHEHAVVRAAERETFYALLEDAMLARGLAPRRSAKSRSKTRPLV